MIITLNPKIQLYTDTHNWSLRIKTNNEYYEKIESIIKRLHFLEIPPGDTLLHVHKQMNRVFHLIDAASLDDEFTVSHKMPIDKDWQIAADTQGYVAKKRNAKDEWISTLYFGRSLPAGLKGFAQRYFRSIKAETPDAVITAADQAHDTFSQALKPYHA